MSCKGIKGMLITSVSPSFFNLTVASFRFHSETSIYRTLFGLTFWDIIFTPVPGAFETQFQAGPLDLGEDSFYYARKDLIDQRLGEIREGRGGEILERHDGMYRAKGTCCVGVRWDICDKSDLLEIVDVGSFSSWSTRLI